MRFPPKFRTSNSSGMTLLDVVISLAVFTIAFCAVAYAMGGFMRVSDTLRSEMLIYSTFDQVLQETVERPFSDFEAYNPPNYPAEKTIGTFSIPEVTGTGEIRLSMMKKYGSTDSKLVRMRVLFIESGNITCELMNYKSKLIH